MIIEIMQQFKKVVFNFIILLITTINIFILLPCLFLPANKIQRCFKPKIKLTFFLLKIFYGVKLEISGHENIEHLMKTTQNFIIAPKHQSPLDIYFVLLIFDCPVFILKKELLKTPIFGLYIFFSKMIAIDRKEGVTSLRKILKKTKEAFAQNRPILIFPEGTRVKVGQEINYKSGIVAVYNHLKVPVIPIASNTAEVWSSGYLFKEAKAKVLKIRILPPIPANLDGNEFISLLKNSIESEMKIIHDITKCNN